MRPANSFTSGPWKLETESRSEDGSDLLVTTPDGAWNIADCRDRNGLGVDSVEQAEANARLIAAAPDLLASLTDAAIRCANIHGGRYREHRCVTCKKWIDVIAKAVAP